MWRKRQTAPLVSSWTCRSLSRSLLLLWKEICQMSRKFWFLTPKNSPLFEIEKILVRKWSFFDIFGSRWLSNTSVFFTSFWCLKTMLLGCQSYALRLLLVANERLRCRKWQGQKPQMTTSEAPNDKSTSKKWRRKSMKVKILYSFLF